MMLRSAARGAWEFVVGDDWRLALGVAATLGAAAAAAAAGLAAWWIAPIAIPVVLYLSVRRAAPRRPRRRSPAA
jgi:hypothetical protein